MQDPVIFMSGNLNPSSKRQIWSEASLCSDLSPAEPYGKTDITVKRSNPEVVFCFTSMPADLPDNARQKCLWILEQYLTKINFH